MATPGAGPAGGRRGACSLPMAKSGCRLAPRHNSRCRERPLGRVCHQPGKDSVNIQQPLAGQTRFQTGACNPLTRPSREAEGAVLPPGVLGRDSVRGPGPGPLQGSSLSLGVTAASANLSSRIQRCRMGGPMAGRHPALAGVKPCSARTSPCPLLCSLRSPESVAPRAQDSVGASTVNSVSGLLCWVTGAATECAAPSPAMLRRAPARQPGGGDPWLRSGREGLRAAMPVSQGGMGQCLGLASSCPCLIIYGLLRAATHTLV